ncbi:MAG: ABC transporter permease subunit [Rhizobiales bacterium]|nr:ABC transporter permease subunit [Hyphomicrobiales bacterium]
MAIDTLSLSRQFPRWRLRWERLRGNILLVVVMAVLLAMIVIPIGRLLINSFLEGHPALPEGWTLQNYTTAFGMPLFYQALATTLVLATIGTAITVVIAVLFAWLIERTDMPCRNLAWALILIPMAIPGVLFALGWALLLSPKTGAMNVFLRDVFALFGVEITEGPINIYSIGGLIFLDGLRGVTTVFLMVVGAFRMMDPSLEEAARVSKAGTVATFFRVTLPALSPAILAAAMYSFISSMESFEAPLAIGLPANIFVLSTLIYFTTRIQAPLDYGLAAVFGVSYMILMVFLLIWYRRAVRNSERFATVSGKGFRPRIVSIGQWRYPALALFVVYFLFAVAAPFCVLLWTSLLPGYRVPSIDAIRLITLDNYREIFATDRVFEVIWNTLVLMVVAATATMVLAFLASWIIVRAPVRGRGLLDGLMFVPHAIPGIVIALALIMAFLTPPLRYTGLYGTMGILVIGLVIAYISFGTRLMNSAIMQVHKELEQAAYVSGASTAKTLFFITLPLLFPAFAAGWIWVAVHALRAFSIPLMLSSKNNEVFAVLLWEFWENGTASLASGLGVLLIIALIPLSLLMRRFIVQVSGQQG